MTNKLKVWLLPLYRCKKAGKYINIELYDRSITFEFIKIKTFITLINGFIHITPRLIFGSEFNFEMLVVSCCFVLIFGMIIVRYITFPIPFKYWDRFYNGNYDVVESCDDIYHRVNKRSVAFYKPGEGVPFNVESNEPLKNKNLIITSIYDDKVYFFDKNDIMLYRLASKHVRKC